jgi:hypothetical protein
MKSRRDFFRNTLGLSAIFAAVPRLFAVSHGAGDQRDLARQAGRPDCGFGGSAAYRLGRSGSHAGEGLRLLLVCPSLANRSSFRLHSRLQKRVISINPCLWWLTIVRFVETALPITPKCCPICGHDSIRSVTRGEVLNLYRCREGRFFVLDPVPQDKQDEKATERPKSR